MVRMFLLSSVVPTYAMSFIMFMEGSLSRLILGQGHFEIGEWEAGSLLGHRFLGFTNEDM